MDLIVDVERLVENRFPEVLFERLSRRLGDEDKIQLVPDPNALQTVEEHAERFTGSAPPTTDTVLHQRDEEGIRDAQANAGPVNGWTDDNDEQATTSTAGCETTRFAALNPPMLEQIYSDVIKALYDSDVRKWKAWPRTDVPDKEEDISNFLNEIVKKACDCINKRRNAAGLGELTPSVFRDQHANVPAEADEGEDVPMSMPDIVLRAKGDAHSKTWDTIRGLILVDSDADASVFEGKDKLSEYVRLIFDNQKNRRFVLCATLFDTKLRLWKYDRSGLLASKEFDTHRHPQMFLRIILGLSLGEEYFVGYDPSFICKSDGDYIKLNGNEYRILEKKHSSSDITGRGSLVLLVEDPVTKEKKIVKDQWVDVSRETKECDIFKVLAEKQVKNVVTCEQYQLVHFKVGREGIEKDTTRNDRDPREMEQVYYLDLKIRDHYRLLISPYGDRLENFRSLRELVCVMRDCFKVIQDMHEENIVHGDISVKNVILVEAESELELKGYLIDFDNALLQPESDVVQREHWGTLPFMAIEILEDNKITHRYYHDVESLFYVLIWICLTQRGPSKQWRSQLEIENAPLHLWFTTGEVNRFQMQNIAYRKGRMLRNPTLFDRRILSDLPPYFRPLKSLLWDLRGIIFDRDQLIRTRGGSRVDVQMEPKYIEERDHERVFADIFSAFDVCLAQLSEEKPEIDPPQGSVVQDTQEDAFGAFVNDKTHSDCTARNVELPKGEDRQHSLPSGSQHGQFGSKYCGEKRSYDDVAQPSSSSSKRTKRSDD